MSFVDTILRTLTKGQLSRLERSIQKIHRENHLSPPGSAKFYKFWNATYPSRWYEFGPPMRPSKSDVELYRKLILQRKNKTEKAVILGSTPELRDLLAEVGILTTAVTDFSIGMLEGMTRFLKIAKPENEIWLKANWISAPLSHKYFDLVISDLPFDQLAKENIKLLLEKIRNILTPEGSLIVRVHYPDPKLIKETPNKIIEETLNYTGSLDDGLLRGVLGYRLLDRSRDLQTFITNRSAVIQWLETTKDLFQGKKREIIERSIQFHLKPRINLSILDEDYLLREIQEYFQLVDRLSHSDHPDATQFPILILSPKNGLTQN